jgi:hypothetical protein
MRYLLLGAADAHGKVLSRHPCHCAYTGYLEKIGNMLGIVDLIEGRGDRLPITAIILTM